MSARPETLVRPWVKPTLKGPGDKVLPSGYAEWKERERADAPTS